MVESNLFYVTNVRRDTANGGKEKEKRKEKAKGKEKGKGRWKKDSLRNVRRMHARMDTKVILYSVRCYALHWTDNDQFWGNMAKDERNMWK